MFFFFFQAEDGIRDIGVTGVQTCALPISPLRHRGRTAVPRRRRPPASRSGPAAGRAAAPRGPRRSSGSPPTVATPDRKSGVLGKRGDLRGRRIIKKKKKHKCKVLTNPSEI